LPKVDLRPFYPPRPEESRKGDFGRVLVVGGSETYSGAPAFNALAALRCGADLVHVLAPRRAADLIASYGPDLITHPLDARHPTWTDVETVGARADVMVIGGGIERSPEAHRALQSILAAWKRPLVVDAEALRALSGNTSLVAGKAALLTPNSGEFEALAGHAWPAQPTAREEAARALARKYAATVIVKGRFEIISDGEQVFRDEAGSSYLTKGGYGDLLAGAAAALLARGNTPFDAARAAAYIIGSAGALAAQELGESTLASDTLARIPHVLRSQARK
jgi:NAD(P)H-hydrate epimerase